MTFAELRDILNSIEKGSSEIDKHIADTFGIPINSYSTSIDAILPKENILEMRKIIDQNEVIHYLSIHCPEQNGEGTHYASVAKTEALSRRLAVVLSKI